MAERKSRLAGRVLRLVTVNCHSTGRPETRPVATTCSSTARPRRGRTGVTLRGEPATHHSLVATRPASAGDVARTRTIAAPTIAAARARSTMVGPSLRRGQPMAVGRSLPLVGSRSVSGQNLAGGREGHSKGTPSRHRPGFREKFGWSPGGENGRGRGVSGVSGWRYWTLANGVRVGPSPSAFTH